MNRAEMLTEAVQLAESAADWATQFDTDPAVRFEATIPKAVASIALSLAVIAEAATGGKAGA